MPDTLTAPPLAADRDAIVSALATILYPGQVTEVRALASTTADAPRAAIRSGFFDDPEALADAVYGLRSARGVYFTPNPVRPGLLPRSPNRLQVARAGELTHDDQVEARRWLLVDADPLRPAADSSSTDAEHDAALLLVEHVVEVLAEDGIVAAVHADSGNGGHLMYPIDLPAGDGGLVERVLHALAGRFNAHGVRIDTAVHNPARIWKLPGTPVCKGAPTAERPHRMAAVLSATEELEPLTAGQLEELIRKLGREVVAVNGLGFGAAPAAPVAAGNLGGVFDATAAHAPADGSPVATGGRNVALASLVGQWARDGKSYAAILADAHAWNATNRPPLTRREVNSTVDKVVGTVDRRNPGVAVPYVDIGVEQVPADPVVAVEPPPVAQPSPPSPAATFPAHLLAVPGFVGEVCAWINATAYKPQPVLTLANALAFFGAVIGRKVRTPSDLRTNLYCLGVGDSGSGKDHSRRAVKKICDAAGLTAELLGGEEVSSDTAITAALFEHPSLLFQFDEIGHLIAQANSRYAATHQRNIGPTLTKLFSSAGTTFLGKAMATRKRQDIDQPNACIYGTTVPGTLYAGLTPAEVTDGFLGRMLVFKSDDPDPAECEVDHADVPDAIVKMVAEWHRRPLPPAPAGAGNLYRQRPLVVPFDDEATAELRRFAVRCRERKAAHRADRRGMDALWARGVEHATKLALIVACGVDYQQPAITGDVAKWAVGLVDHVTAALVDTVQDSVAGSDFERELLKVRRHVREAGPDGITTTRLSRLTQHIKPQLRTEILNQLVGSGSVAKRDHKPARGPTATAYVWASG